MAAAQGTPESDTGSFECFRNYTAPEVFVQGLAGIVDQQDVESMIRAQKQMLQRFEKTNEMLTNCNQLSINRLKTAGTEFKKHTALLIEMKRDLDYIFKRIRLVKNKLSQQYPQAFNEAVRSSLAEEVIVEDVDCPVKPLEPEIVPLPSAPAHCAADRDPDSDGNETSCSQSCVQFLRSNESAVLEAVGLVPSGESVEVFGEHGANGIGGGNQCSVHYTMRSNSNPGVGAIQHAASNAAGALHHYPGAAHAPKRRASDTP